MRQVVQNLRNGTTTVPEVPSPSLRPGGILVRTLYSVISAGTEGSRLKLARSSLLGKARQRPELVQQVFDSVRREGIRSTVAKVRDRLDVPKAPGYSLSGQVIAVADNVDSFAVGDRVACAGEGYASHAEVTFVPANLAAHVPAGVRPTQAAFVTLGAIALHGVRLAQPQLGDTVAVIGLGLIGQLAWRLLRASGTQPVGIDILPAAVERAREAGLETALLRSAPVTDVIEGLTAGAGVDAVLICADSQSNDPLELASILCRDRGCIVAVGATRMDVPRSVFYRKELSLRVSRSYGPGRYDASYEERGHDYPRAYVRWTEQRNFGAFLDLLADGRVDIDDLLSQVLPVTRAPAAYELIGRGPSEAAAVLLEYPGASATDWPAGKPSAREDTKITFAPASRKSLLATTGVGLVGAGNFARSVILPAVRGARNVRLTGVVTARPHTAAYVAERHGFEFAGASMKDLLQDESTDTVIIATRHDSHAVLAEASLAAGKATFVEKPLALSTTELDHVLETQSRTGARLCVGFNRRFAPAVRQGLQALPQGVPRQVLIRVNAGQLPDDHWLRDPVVGGGRLIGEGCHFIDLAAHIAGGTMTDFSAVGTPDAFNCQLRYSTGSLASIVYATSGAVALPKEYIEVSCAGVSIAIDDYARLTVFDGRRRRRTRFRTRDKGHAGLLGAFLSPVGDEFPIPVRDIRASHEVTLALSEMLRPDALA